MHFLSFSFACCLLFREHRALTVRCHVLHLICLHEERERESRHCVSNILSYLEYLMCHSLAYFDAKYCVVLRNCYCILQYYILRDTDTITMYYLVTMANFLASYSLLITIQTKSIATILFLVVNIG